MCKPIKCPACGHEFTIERERPAPRPWTPEEDKALLEGYQKERKTIYDLADELNRSTDGIRNRLYALRGGAVAKKTVNVSLTAEEFDEMRAARVEVKQARAIMGEKQAAESAVAAFCNLGARLIEARVNKRAIAPLFEELDGLVTKYGRANK